MFDLPTLIAQGQHSWLFLPTAILLGALHGLEPGHSKTMIAAFIGTYGYFAVFLGTLLEGETILIIAGFLAHQGHFHLPLVILVAFIER